MSNLIKGTHHIAVKYENPEAYKKAITFYTELLGMTFVRSWGEGESEGCMIDIGDGTMMELYASGRTLAETGCIHHFALATDDVDTCVSNVREAGYEITIEPRDIVIGSEPPYPARIAFCKGPAGEEIEFFHVK